MRTVWQDVRYGIRALSRNPGFALAACYLPARRAARLDPMEALRHE